MPMNSSSVSSRFSLIPAADVILRRGSSILLQLRQNTGYMDGYWATGAAGHVEAGESVTQAGVREAAEELGIRTRQGDLAPVAVMHRTQERGPVGQRVDWFFVADHWEAEPRIVEPEKCAALRWFELDALPEPMPPHELAALAVLRSRAPFTHLECGFDEAPSGGGDGAHG